MINGLEFIYKITNPKGNTYIGKTKNWVKRFNQYNKNSDKITQPKLQYSIKKYGWQNHKLELIEICENSMIDSREMYWIKFYNSYHYNNINGLNLTTGGEGGKGSRKPMHGTPIEQRDKQTLEVIKVWEKGMGQILQETAFKNQPIYEAIKGVKQMYAYGYVWNYLGKFKGVRNKKGHGVNLKTREKYKNGILTPTMTGKVGILNKRSKAVFIKEIGISFESLNLAAKYFKENIFPTKSLKNIYMILHKHLKNKIKTKKWTIKYI